MPGYVSTTRQIPLYSGPDVPCTWNNLGITTKFMSSEVRTTESVRSWRSGTSYDRAISEGGVPIPDLTSVYGRLLGDNGHEFDHYVERCWTSMTNYSLSGGNKTFNGLILSAPGTNQGIPTGGGGGVRQPLMRSEAALTTDGAKLVQLSSPLKSQANLIGAIAEILKDGIPDALFNSITQVASGKKRGLISAIAGDYLNYMFAVSPTIRDIQKLIEGVMQIDRMVRQLKRDSGRDIFRKRGLPNVETVVSSDWTNESFRIEGPSYMPIGSPWTVSNSPLTSGSSITTDTRSTWFTGSFTYYLERILPPQYMTEFFGSVLNAKSKEQINDIIAGGYLLGASPVNIDVKLAWQLTPFSWLVDWFANVGTVIDNAQTFNNLGLVMNYGYLMCKETRDVTSTYRLRNGSTQTMHFRSERKRRRRANPFGFGLTDSSLSTTQQALLGALVLSRR